MISKILNYILKHSYSTKSTFVSSCSTLRIIWYPRIKRSFHVFCCRSSPIRLFQNGKNLVKYYYKIVGLGLMMSIDASFSCSAVPHFFSMLCTLSELRVLPHTHTTTTLASYVVKDSASETNFQSIKDLALCCIKWPSGGIHRFLLFGVRRFEKKIWFALTQSGLVQSSHIIILQDHYKFGTNVSEVACDSELAMIF